MTTQKWRMVPVEPTPEMMRSGMNVPINKAARHNAVYRSMLEAAPLPPKLSDDRILEIGAMAKAQWNAAADQYNQWRELDSDEITILIARAIEREILEPGS
jgi:hypothetical protein